ncbi:MAG: alpha/beta hydrolase [Clostridiales Family XIII bacterium]|jgi:pimeloyl-ACP methyl ester carboxylesterase|nr:alpha/beta hydrolase [Clostridiales Family XIII bacterium]
MKIPVQEGSFISTDGAEIFFTARGGGNAAPPVVIVHGIFETRWKFARVADRVARETGRLCVTAEIRGHGKSRADGYTFTTRQFAEDLDALLTHVGVREKDGAGQGGCVLCGYSLGAYLCMNYLQEFGFPRIRALALLDWSPKALSDGEWHMGVMRGAYGSAQLRRDLGWIAEEGTFYAFLANFIYHSIKMQPRRGYREHPPLWARTASKYVCENSPSNREHLKVLWEAFEDADYRPLLAEIAEADVPTLLVCAVPGTLFVPEAADYMKERIGRCARVVRVGGEGFNGVSHSALPNQRRRLAKELLAFLASID